MLGTITVVVANVVSSNTVTEPVWQLRSTHTFATYTLCVMGFTAIPYGSYPTLTVAITLCAKAGEHSSRKTQTKRHCRANISLHSRSGKLATRRLSHRTNPETIPCLSRSNNRKYCEPITRNTYGSFQPQKQSGLRKLLPRPAVPLLQHRYGAKKPEISSSNCVVPEAPASILPLLVGTTAMFEVMKPSAAFSVETVGWGSPSGHKVR